MNDDSNQYHNNAEKANSDNQQLEQADQEENDRQGNNLKPNQAKNRKKKNKKNKKPAIEESQKSNDTEILERSQFELLSNSKDGQDLHSVQSKPIHQDQSVSDPNDQNGIAQLKQAANPKEEEKANQALQPQPIYEESQKSDNTEILERSQLELLSNSKDRQDDHSAQPQPIYQGQSVLDPKDQNNTAQVNQVANPEEGKKENQSMQPQPIYQDQIVSNPTGKNNTSQVELLANPEVKKDEKSTQPQQGHEEQSVSNLNEQNNTKKDESPSKYQGDSKTIAEPDTNRLLHQALEIKSKADKLSANKEYQNAINHCKEALKWLRSEEFKIGSEEFAKMVELKNTLLNDVSQYYINLQDYREAAWYAERVILTDRKNVEALYKIAHCKQQLGDAQNAYEKFSEIVEIYKQKGTNPPPEITDTVLALRKILQTEPLPKGPLKSPNEERKEQKKKAEKKGEEYWENQKIFLKKALLAIPSAAAAWIIIKLITKQPLSSVKIIPLSVSLTILFFMSMVEKTPSRNKSFRIASFIFPFVLFLLHKNFRK